MYKAIDNNGLEVLAKTAERYTEYFCPDCNENVFLRKGKKKSAHFAHYKETNCRYGRNGDNKTEWHIRMQGYFTDEETECRFIDKERGEKHIADVFLKDSNTVIEFQHSPISLEEYKSRTAFHIKNGRRIAWLFDESMISPKEKQEENTVGNFKLDREKEKNGIPFFEWLGNPREFLKVGPNVKEEYASYSVWVYTGTDDGDVFHRIIDTQEGYNWVAFSPTTISMGDSFNVERLFANENYWIMEIAKSAALANQQLEDYLRAQQQRRQVRIIPSPPYVRRRGRGRF